MSKREMASEDLTSYPSNFPETIAVISENEEYG